MEKNKFPMSHGWQYFHCPRHGLAGMVKITILPRMGNFTDPYFSSDEDYLSQSAKDFFFGFAKSIFSRTLVYAEQNIYVNIQDST